jgi:rhomboid protease GluP
VPVVSVAFAAVVLATRATQLVVPGWYDVLARHPGAVAWRSATALIAYDDGWVQFLSIFIGALVLGFIAERRFGPLLWAAILIVCGLAGQVIALFWQPEGAGSSVAVAGWLGAAMAWMAWPATGVPVPARVGPIVVFALGVWLVAVHDIHGPPILIGGVFGALSIAAGWTTSGRAPPPRTS